MVVSQRQRAASGMIQDCSSRGRLSPAPEIPQCLDHTESLRETAGLAHTQRGTLLVIESALLQHGRMSMIVFRRHGGRKG